jgi:TRAP transporter 4TM/12TM fusion protein
MAAEATLKHSEATESSVLTARRWSDLADPAALIALAWSLFQIAIVIWPNIDTLTQRALHVGFALSLAYAMFGRNKETRRTSPLYLLLAVLAITPSIYIAFNSYYLTSERIQGLDAARPLDYVFGILLIILLFEAARRTLGLGLTIFTGIFVLYFFGGGLLPGELAHRYTGLERFIDTQFLSLHGIFGVPVGVSVSTVFYFIFFAAIYDIYGGGRFIIDLAFALTGRTVGGPAKAAVVSSGLLGSVSGSAVANVMSTGIFTIPLMKRVGYKPTFAGGVEAAASTGGQLVPPVMGAAAFIMADYLRLPYATIALAAVVPSLLYYAALLVMVDFSARLNRLAVDDNARSPIIEVLKARGHLVIPLAWLVYRIVGGFPVENAALESSALAVLVGTLRSGSRRPPLALVEAFIVSAERTVSVALPCALAGIVVGVIAFTGLGTKFTGLMIWLSAGKLAPLLVLTMVASLILGTGMPTTSAYIMAAVLLAPALVAVGAEPLTAHFFIFYFSILSMVTPPVALAAYAAASISRASPSTTGWTAFGLSFPGFLIPYTAVMHPGLLLIGSAWDTAWGILNVLAGLVAISAALIGWLFRRLSMPWRVLLAATGIATTLPDFYSTAIAVTVLTVSVGWLWINRETRPAAEVT